MKLPTQINTLADVYTFLDWCIENLGLGFHPDTEFGDYINEKGEPSFAPEQRDTLDILMQDAFELCESRGLDIYELAFDKLKPSL